MVTAGVAEASWAKWLSVRFANCPKPARIAVLPSPNTSQAKPNRTAGMMGACGYIPSGSLGVLALEVSIPGVALGVVEYPPTAAGTRVPWRAKNVVVPVFGSTATWFAVGQALVAVETVQPGR